MVTFGAFGVGYVDQDEAWRDVESIMNRMNVGTFDLFQLPHRELAIPAAD